MSAAIRPSLAAEIADEQILWWKRSEWTPGWACQALGLDLEYPDWREVKGFMVRWLLTGAECGKAA